MKLIKKLENMEEKFISNNINIAKLREQQSDPNISNSDYTEASISKIKLDDSNKRLAKKAQLIKESDIDNEIQQLYNEIDRLNELKCAVERIRNY